MNSFLDQNFKDNEEKTKRLTNLLKDCGFNEIYENDFQIENYSKYKIFGNNEMFFQNEFESIDK